MNRHILLAYGEREFTKRLKTVLEQKGHTATILGEGEPPRARYDLIIQLARDPAQLAEGTRLLLGKIKRDRSRLILLIHRLDEKLYEEAARFAQTLVEEAARQHETETVVLNLARLYGPDIPARDSGALGHLVTEFAAGNILTLYGEGKDRDYYLFTADALEGIALAAERATAGETYALAPSVAIDSEAIAKLLYELGGGRHEISFHRGLSAVAEKGEVPGKPLPEFKVRTPFHEGILTILKSAPPAPQTREGIHLPRLRLPLIHWKWKKPQFSQKSLVIAGIVLALLSPLLYLGGAGGWALYQFSQLKSAVNTFDFARVQTAARRAAGGLDQLGRFSPLARSLAESARAGADLAAEGDILTTTLENLLKSRRGEALTSQSTGDFRNLAAAFSATEEQLTLAWLEAQSPVPSFLENFARKVRTTIEEALAAARFGTAFAQSAEELLGYKGARNYLLLFQNSAEIWPGGGFVGSLANLTLENGGIKELKFYDVYDFNQYSTLEGGWARNVSLNPDFSVNAQNFGEVFQRATGVAIDGVIGVDLRVAQQLLAITGPITLTDFNNQEITAENFFEVTTREVETDFFPGSSKKKRFIQALGEAVLAKLFETPASAYLSTAQLFWEQLQQKGVLLYLTDASLYQVAVEQNFAGRIKETSGDYLAALDHNAGTKGTVWVDRTLEYKVDNSDRFGTLRGELKVTWHNGGTEAWPAGEYNNLFWALVPRGAVLVSGTWADQDVTTAVGTRERNGKTSFEYRISVPPGETKTLTLVYTLPPALNLNQLTTYHLTVQKQPGTIADAFRFVFEEPLGYVASSTDLQKIENQLIFEGSLEKDLNLELELKKE